MKSSVALTTFALLGLLSTSFGGVANAGAGTIQPGDMHNFSCTLNFVYDGLGAKAGKVYIGTAGHCVNLGQTATTLAVGAFGTVVYDGNDADTRNDFALIEVAPAFHSAVVADVRGHPGMPNGLATEASAAPGTIVRMSGWGTATSDTQPGRESRLGVVTSHEDGRVGLAGVVSGGDSGGPWMTHGGHALATVKGIDVEFSSGTNGVHLYAGMTGPSVEQSIAAATAAGFPIALRTA